MSNLTLSIIGIILPFIGTMIGVSLVFFLRSKMPDIVNKLLLGFSSGIMIAASVWSLLIPSIESGGCLPATLGFVFGILFLLVIDIITEKMEFKSNKSSFMLMLSVTIHNIPEGMAVGVAFAGLLAGSPFITVASAFALTIGISVQNVPEGAIISLPLKSLGMGLKKTFGYGLFSAIVEPIFGFITILLINLVVPILPYLLSFAAGAMIYVVVNELIPNGQCGKHKNVGTLGITFGFIIMMVLDVILG